MPLICGLCCWLAGLAQAAPMALTDGAPMRGWGRQLEVLEDPSGQLSWQQVCTQDAPAPWRPLQADNPHFGYSRAAFWLRVELVNADTTQHDWLLGLRYPLLDQLDVYFQAADGHVTRHATGDMRPFEARPIKDRLFYFPFALSEGQHLRVCMRMAGQGSLQAPLELTTPQQRQTDLIREQGWLGLYGGALLAMLLYNLLLYISLRDRSYLLYVGYLAAFAMAQLSLNGMAFEYLWPTQPVWGNRATPLFMSLTGLMLSAFTREFLGLKTHAPLADRSLQALQWTFAAMLPAVWLMGYNIPIRITTTATIASTVLQLLVSVDMLRRGVRQAQYFLAAFSLLLLGVMASALQMFNLVPASWLTEYGIQIGSALEITLLSFALAHRLELMQTENLHLQQAHAAELEARVQARTQEVALAMQALTEANSRLQDLSVRDVLTGLHNRQFLAEHLPEMWRFAHRWHHPISVLMIDIDHFKQVNDQHGHACGDEALRQVAQAINTTLRRPGDQAIRYGGEEFLVVLPLTPADGGQQMARAILQAIEGLRLQHNGQLVPLTVSIGGASCTPGPEDETRTLLQAADEKLYQAKHAGRNRIEWAA